MDASIVIIDEYAPPAASWFHGRSLLLFLDILCCCGILCLLERRIRHLHAAADTAAGAQRCALCRLRQLHGRLWIWSRRSAAHEFMHAPPLPRARASSLGPGDCFAGHLHTALL